MNRQLFRGSLILVGAAAILAGAGTEARTTAERVPALAQAGPLRFAAIGDFGTGEGPEYQIAAQAEAARARTGLDLVLLLGDNLYGSQDFVAKFEQPYKALLAAKVPFYAALGNHDSQIQIKYPGFHMQGQRYYSFSTRGVRFIVLDSNMLDNPQLAWVKRTLAESTDEWIVMTFHHPLYSDAGRHGSTVELRVALEPLLVQYGVDVVFSGHDHIYERVKPQKGVTYFVVGSGGKLAMGDVRASAATAASFDTDQAFVLADVQGDSMHFQAISRTGAVVDSGTIPRRPKDVQ